MNFHALIDTLICGEAFKGWAILLVHLHQGEVEEDTVNCCIMAQLDIGCL